MAIRDVHPEQFAVPGPGPSVISMKPVCPRTCGGGVTLHPFWFVTQVGHPRSIDTVYTCDVCGSEFISDQYTQLRTNVMVSDLGPVEKCYGE